MKTSRTAQLIYQSFYCALGLVAVVASFGIFDDYTMFRWDFYVHFTNLSNYFCIGIMVAQLIQTARKKEDSYITAAPLLKFIGVLAILLTFVVFNVMLAGAEGRDPQLNWRIGSLTFHGNKLSVTIFKHLHRVDTRYDRNQSRYVFRSLKYLIYKRF